MNRISDKFSQLKSENKKALIPYITAGDPCKESTVDLMHRLVKGGASIIELGIPFSDPAADGETIQLAGQRALSKGVNFEYVLDTVKAFRRNDNETPIILMGYLNSFERHGVNQIFKKITQAGADAVILVDCTVEGFADYKAALEAADLPAIQLVAPTTTERRKALILEEAKGFVYYVSLRGVTGRQKASASDIKQEVLNLREKTSVPVCVGFGIRDEQTAKAMAEFADGVIIGSALVKLLQEAQQSNESILDAAESFIQKIRLAIDA